MKFLVLLFIFCFSGLKAQDELIKHEIVREGDSIQIEYLLTDAVDTIYQRKMYKYDVLIESLFLYQKKRVGAYKRYSFKGALIAAGAFSRKGEKQGPWVNYYPSGTMASKTFYEEGHVTGNATFYYENGRMRAIGDYLTKKHAYVVSGYAMEYKVESKIGDWIYYYDNRQIESKGTYWFGEVLRDYSYRESDDPGASLGELERQWKIDLKHGKWSYWSRTGKLLKTEYYDKGTLLEVEEAKD
jgi:antitoxin component YwqK of YwqJK toxin-antitoxin module